MEHAPIPTRVTTVPEPALRPCGQREPNLSVVRHTRLYWDGQSLVVTTPVAPARHYPVGPGGVERAVHIDVVGEAAAHLVPPAGEWGALDLQNGAGERLLRLPLRDWLPEASSSLTRPATGRRLLELTGASELLKTAGIPLKVATSLQDPLLAQSLRGPNTDVQVCRPLPAWHAWVRGVSMAVWSTCLLAGLMWRADAPWLLALAAAALLCVPAADALVKLRGRAREGRSAAQEAEAIVRPHPAVDAGATRRFCAIAEVRVLVSDIVVVDSLGRERWLSRTGLHGVTKVVRVVDRVTRQPLAVELRGPGGDVRAALPWPSWFGGVEDGRGWSTFSAAVGCPAEDEPAPKSAGATPAWPVGGVALEDAEAMGPLTPKSARHGSDFYTTAVRDRSTLIIPLFAAVSAVGGIGVGEAERGLGVITAALGVLALAAVVGPVAVRQLYSRLHLDRPALFAPEVRST